MRNSLLKALALVALLGLTSCVFASSEPTHTDIMPRTVNFLIFTAVIYYLVADKIKQIFVDRKVRITSALESREVKLKESHEAIAKAQEALQNAQKLAEEMIQVAKNDAVLNAGRIKTAAESEAAMLDRHFHEDCDLIKKKTVMRAVEEELNQIFTLKGFGIENKDFAEILAKKVAK